MRSSSLLILALGCAPAQGTLGSLPGSSDDPTGPATVPTADGPADGSPPTDGSSDTGPYDPPPFPIDPTDPGPYTLVTTEKVFSASCEMTWVAVTPDGRDPIALVVLSHGFLLDGATVMGWAEHWASWGYAVAVPDLCHSRAIDSDATLNGADIAALGQSIANGSEIYYVGHSAGGLASLLAPASSPSAAGVIGLDLVDDLFGAGLAAAGELDLPVAGLVAEPEFCNSYGNGVDVLSAVPHHEIWRLVGTDHCDYTNPHQPLCDLACADGTADQETSIELVAGMTLAWLHGHTGTDERLLDWWNPEAEQLGGLIEDGLVAAP